MVGKLLVLLAERDRLVLLPDLLAAYRERLLDHQQRRARRSDDRRAAGGRRAQRSSAASRSATGRTVHAVDAASIPSIIGGVVARIGSTVYDGSVTNQLQRMKQRLEETACRLESMDIKAEEISKIIREQIGSYAVDVDVAEVGSIISIGDGIARVHGVENAMAGEMLEFPHGVFGIALNLEEESVGAVLLGEFKEIKEGDHGQAHRPHHLGAGRRRDARPRRQRARPADRRQGPDRHEAVLADRAPGARRRRSPAGARSRCRPGSRRSTRWCRSAAASAS